MLFRSLLPLPEGHHDVSLLNTPGGIRTSASGRRPAGSGVLVGLARVGASSPVVVDVRWPATGFMPCHGDSRGGWGATGVQSGRGSWSPYAPYGQGQSVPALLLAIWSADGAGRPLASGCAVNGARHLTPPRLRCRVTRERAAPGPRFRRSAPTPVTLGPWNLSPHSVQPTGGARPRPARTCWCPSARAGPRSHGVRGNRARPDSEESKVGLVSLDPAA